MVTRRFNPDYAVPPGATLRELMADSYLTPKLVSIMTDLSAETIEGICDGKVPITFEMADSLALAFGVPSSFWNNRELNYRKQLAKGCKVFTDEDD